MLHAAGLLERPHGGDVIVNNRACGRLSDDDRTAIRRNEIGFVYQFHQLLPEFSALENIMMPQLIKGLSKKEAAERAAQLLDYMQIGKRAQHRPSELSGGEQQRVAIARALANKPRLLLADEPTGNLDTESTDVVMTALRDIQRDFDTTVIIVTHDTAIAASVDRVITLIDGHIASDADPRVSAQLDEVKILREKRATGELPLVQVDKR
jgi:lipoprotein-releasing system ATP-binding protein